MRNKVVCLTTIYPGVEDYIEEYLQSIQNQACADFDLVIVNDDFSLPIDHILDRMDIKAKVFDSSLSPQANRLYGLRMCRDMGYDIIICGDADDVMSNDRVEKVVAYFSENKESRIVYNDLVNKEFNLVYKDKITLEDILDFNVLGFSCLNIKSDLVEFVLNHQNEKIPAFDWWFALVYLLNFKQVDFLKDVKSYYRMHPGNYVGPTLDINEDRLKRGIYVKRNTYSELCKYCKKNGFVKEENIFLQKNKEIDGIENFIKAESFGAYYEMVKSYLADVSKMFWWQDVVSLNELGKVVS